MRHQFGVSGLVGAGLALLWMGAAQAAPSFDCKAAGTPVEKAICADQALAAADQELANTYKKLQALSDAPERERLRAEQRAWLGQRNQCATAAKIGACLSETLRARVQALNAALPGAVAGITRTVASIPADAQGAVRRLADVREPLGKGWTAYLLRYGPAPDKAKATATMREAVAGIDDDYARDVAGTGDLATDEGFLTALRIVSDHYEMAWPCFVMERHGQPAWKAQGPLYGSSRDGAGPMPDCSAGGALLATPAWKAVEDLLSPMVGAAFGRTGTIRSSFGRQMAVEDMMSAVDPRLLAEGAPPLAKQVDEIAAWSNPRWVGADWGNRLRAAVKAVVDGWVPGLAARYRIGQPEARRIAEGVASVSLGTSVGFLSEYVTLDGDTRLPEWLRGTWTWSGGAEGTPFTAPSGRAVIDAANVCVGKECEGFDVSTAGDAVEVDARDVKAAGVKLAPDWQRRAVELTSAQSGTMAKAVPLADGGVLVAGYEKPVILRRAAK